MNSIVTVETYDLAYQAQFARSELEAEGIQCWLADETLVAMDWFISNAVGGIKLQVAFEDFVEAREILNKLSEKARLRDETSKDIWVAVRCSRCKEHIAFSGPQIGRVETCPLCARYVDVPDVSDPSLDAEVIQTIIEKFRDNRHQDSDNLLATRIYWCVELFFVLCFAYFPDLANAVRIYCKPLEYGDLILSSNEELMRRSATVLFWLLPVHMLSMLPLSTIGLSVKRLVQDTGVGLLLGVLFFGFNFLAHTIFYDSPSPINYDSAIDRLSQIGVGAWLFYGLAVVSNSFAEEIVMRGYLVDRFERLLGNTWLAVFIAATLFGSYHIYQGWIGAGCAALMGVVFGSWFVWTRRLCAPIVAHTICNVLCGLVYY